MNAAKRSDSSGRTAVDGTCQRRSSGSNLMSGQVSISHWIQQLKEGEQAGIQALWDRYFTRLVELARKKLAGAPRRAADEEDVALSAFDTFCRRAAEGHFPRLADRDDLWQILVMLTLRKAVKRKAS